MQFPSSYAYTCFSFFCSLCDTIHAASTWRNVYTTTSVLLSAFPVRHSDLLRYRVGAEGGKVGDDTRNICVESLTLGWRVVLFPFPSYHPSASADNQGVQSEMSVVLRKKRHKVNRRRLAVVRASLVDATPRCGWLWRRLVAKTRHRSLVTSSLLVRQPFLQVIHALTKSASTVLH